jgi:hypothetical protein
MAYILASFDTASLNSVMNCCTTVTTLAMLSRGKLFTIGVGTDWPASCHFSEVLSWSKFTADSQSASVLVPGTHL